MKKLVLGICIGICLPIIAGLGFIFAGGMPVATKGPPLPLEKWIARQSLHRAIGNAEEVPSPIPADSLNLAEGARVYVNHCAVCHSLPDAEPTFIARGLFPKPPHLFKGHGVTDDPVGETFWKAKNGIRLTGMPGFADTLTEKELWQVSQLLTNADKLPSDVRTLLKGKPR